MKKLFVFIITFTCCICASALDVSVLLKSSNSYVGTVKELTDKSITIDYQMVSKATFTANEIVSIFVYAKDDGEEANYYLIPINGKFEKLSISEYKQYKKGKLTLDKDRPSVNYTIGDAQSNTSLPDDRSLVIQDSDSQYSNRPNQAISEALIDAGSLSIKIGIPMMAAGAAILAGSFSSKISPEGALACSIIGGIVGGVGGTLTIASIPIFIASKNIGRIDLNINQNGAGVSANF